MTDTPFDPTRFRLGRSVIEAGRQLLEQGGAVRPAACSLFTGDLPSLVSSTLRLLGEPEQTLDFGTVTTILDVAHALETIGISAKVRQADSLEDAAIAITANASVVLALNVGELFDSVAFFDSGDPNCLVMPVWAYRDYSTLDLAGFSIHCPLSAGTPFFVTAELLDRAWLHAGGRMMIANNFFVENVS